MLAAVALVALGALALRPGADAVVVPAHGLAPQERPWASGFMRWQRWLSDETLRSATAGSAGPLGGDEAASAFRRESAELRGCLQRFHEDTPEPVTDRLAALASRVAGVCALVTRNVDGVQRALETEDFDGYIAARGVMDEVAGEVVLVFDELESYTRAETDPPDGAAGERSSYVDGPLSRLARDLVGADDVAVRCWSPEDWRTIVAENEALFGSREGTPAALADPLARKIDLQRAHCAVLSELSATGWSSADDGDVRQATDAVRFLAHEARHLEAWNRSEAETECVALQTMASVAGRLGAPPRPARALAARAWREYPLLDEDYRSAECRPGGGLDLHPETADWPTG